MERVDKDANSCTQSHDKIVICEGRTDAIIMQAIAKRFGREISIISADGKRYIPNIFKKMKDESSILIVVDLDGDEELTRQIFSEQIGAGDYKIAIINNRIEDWFAPKLDGFSKLEILQKSEQLVNETDFDELSKKHKSFATVVDFINGK